MAGHLREIDNPDVGDLRFCATNEYLPGVVGALDLSIDSRCLAILGSGDQAFAMLESAGSVLAIDNRVSQVLYAQRRARHLREGNFDGFREQVPSLSGQTHIDRRNEYFSDARLSRIQANLDSLVIQVGDLHDFAPSDFAAFNRVYLSNALDVSHRSKVTRVISALRLGLPSQSLVYAASAAYWFPSQGFELDENATKQAMESAKDTTAYSFIICVFRKV